MWWSILKSSREEAYAKFVEEFGPGFEIWRLDRHGIQFRENELIRDEWSIHMDNAGDINFLSKKYSPHLTFVQEIFKEEYPERYKEIGDLLEGLILETGKKPIITSDELPAFEEGESRVNWMLNHMFLGDGKPLTRSAKLAILINIIAYYEYGVAPRNLYQILEKDKFEHTDNIRDLFQRYKVKMGKYGYMGALREIRTTSQQMYTVLLLLDGEIPMPSYNGTRQKLTIVEVE